jgi:hypothetical protein
LEFYFVLQLIVIFDFVVSAFLSQQLG